MGILEQCGQAVPEALRNLHLTSSVPESWSLDIHSSLHHSQDSRMSLPEAYGATSVPCFYYSMAICLVLQCATFSHIGCSKPQWLCWWKFVNMF
jgi:hypothetical protein